MARTGYEPVGSKDVELGIKQPSAPPPPGGFGSVPQAAPVRQNSRDGLQKGILGTSHFYVSDEEAYAGDADLYMRQGFIRKVSVSPHAARHG